MQAPVAPSGGSGGGDGSRGRKFKLIAVITAAVILAAVLAFVILGANDRSEEVVSRVDMGDTYETVILPLEGFTVGDQGVEFDSATVVVNGMLQTSGLTVAPGLQPTNARAGQLYYDQTTNELAYFNGATFVTLEDPSAAGVQSIAGATGQLTLGGGLGVVGNQLNNNGVVSFGGQTGAIATGNGLVMVGNTVQNTGVIGIAAGNGIAITDNGGGTFTVANIGAGSGTVASSGGTAGRLPLFTSVQNIEDSLVSQSGMTVTVSGDLSVVTGGLSLSNALTVSNGGTGATSLAANGVIVGAGTGALTSVTAGGPGLCLVSTAGAPNFAACPSSSAVTSLNSLTGALSIANASGAGSTITIDDASTSTKGIAQFNATNFSASGGTVNTIQNINSGATPTFAGVNTNSITPGGAMTVGAAGQTALLQGSTTTITSSAGNDIILTTGDQLRLTGFNCTTFSNGGALTTDASGNVACANDDGGSGGVTSVNTLVGDLIVQGTAGQIAVNDNGSDTFTLSLNSAVTLQGNTFNGSNQLVQLNASTQLPAVSGALLTNLDGGAISSGTVANARLVNSGALTVTAGTNLTGGGSVSLGGSTTLNVTASPTFAGNVVVQGGSTTLGTTTQIGSLVLHDGNGGQTTTVQAGNSTGNLVFILPTSAGSATQCLKQSGTGNQLVWDDCEGGTGGVSGVTTLNSLDGALTIQGTANRITVSDNGTDTITISAPQDIHTAATPTFGGLTLTGDLALNGRDITVTDAGNTTTLTFETPTDDVTYRLRTTTGGPYDICTTAANCVGLGTSITGTGTDGTITMFTDSQEIGDSIITQSGGNTINIAGTLTLNNALGVGQGGTGLSSAPTNGQLLIGNGTGYSLATLTNNGGITITNGAGSIGLAVIYGSGANNAVQGNTSLTCPSGTGNLTGGGNSITLGSGGSCNSINTVNNPNFTTSVTTPTVQNAGLTLASTGANTLQLQTNGSTRLTIASGGDMTATGNMTLQGGSVTLGTTSVAGTLVLSDASSNTGTIQTAALANNRIYTLPDPGGNADICLSTGNCAGSGTGVTASSAGTPGTLPVFTGAQAIADSLVSQNTGTGTVLVAGHLNLTSGNQFQINGTQISSANLSNDSNLAKLGASQTFTGANNAFQNGSNSTNAFNVQNAAGNRILTIDTSNGELELGHGSALDGKLVFNNVGNNNAITIVPGTPSSPRTITLPDDDGIICLDSGNCAGAGATLQTAYNFSAGGTAPKIKVDSTLLGVDIQDADTPTGANLFNVRESNGAGLGQVMFGVGNTGQVTLQNGTNSTTALRLLTDGGTSVLTGDTQNGRTILGQGSTLAGQLLFHNATNNNTGTLQTAALGQATTFTLPDPGGASASICLSTGNCTGLGQVVDSLNGLLGDLTLQGTANQISVNDNGTDTITLSTPQNIHTGASPQFVSLTLTGDAAVNGGDLTSSAQLTINSVGLVVDGSANFVVQDAASFNNTVTLNSDTDWVLSGDENITASIAPSGTTNHDGIRVVTTNSSSSGTQNLMYLGQHAAASGTTEALVVLDNAHGSLAVPVALQVTSAGGGAITTAIDVSDTNIGAAINVGANTIQGTTGDIDMTNFDVQGSSGNVTMAGVLQVGTLGTTNTTTYLCRNGSNQIAACNTTGTGVAFVQGGNSFGGVGILGTNDNEQLEFETSGTTRMRVGGAGNVTVESGNNLTLTNGTLFGNNSSSGAAPVAVFSGTNTSGTKDVVVSMGKSTGGLATTVLEIFQFSGAITNGINFSGTFGTDIQRTSGTLSLNGSTGVTLQANGTTRLAATTTGVDVTGLLTVSSLGAANTSTMLCRNGSNQIASCNTTGAGAAFVQGGNSFGVAATLGTNDATSLILETANTSRVTIADTGDIAISSFVQINNQLGVTYTGTGSSVTDMTANNSSGTAAAILRAVKNGNGNLTTGLEVQNLGAGTMTNGINFTGTMTNDVNRSSGTLSLNGAGGITLAAGGSTKATVGANDIQLASGIDLLLTGSNAFISNPQASTGGEAFGASAVTGNSSVAVGNSASATGANSVVVGRNATDGGFNNGVAIGGSATAGEGAVLTGNDGVAIGYNTSAALQGIAIGVDAQAIFQNSITLGAGAQSSAANQLVIGGPTSGNAYINHVVIGSGTSDPTPTGFMLQGTSGSGSNIAGASVTIAGGQSTGSAVGGSIILQASAGGAPGAGTNSLATLATYAATGITIGNTALNTALTLDSGTGTIAIGTGAQARTINIGTGAAAQTITLGSTNTTSTTTINSGTGNISLQVAGASTTGRVQVGAGGSGSATPDLFGLDVMNTSGDPTGVNGAMYYNATYGRFRCFQNSVWIDCIGGGQSQGPEIVTFTANDTFDKADYPGLVSVKVRLVGGGGGGGGVATTAANQAAAAGGGGGGGYCEENIAASDLSASETVTVGTGGGGGSAGANNGTTGNTSSFGSHCSGSGGGGGDGSTASGGFQIEDGGSGGTASGGDVNITGSDGTAGVVTQDSATAQVAFPGHGGGSMLGGAQKSSETDNGANGLTGQTYGGGGSAGYNQSSQGSARSGGPGADGIVIVELIYSGNGMEASAAEYLRAENRTQQLNSNSETDIDDHIKFANVQASSGSSITLDTTSGYVEGGSGASVGRFTLAAGKTYMLRGTIPFISYSSDAGYAAYTWYNITGSTTIGSSGFSVPATYSATRESDNPYAEAIISPSVTTVVELRLTDASSLTAVGYVNAPTMLGYPSALIEVMSDGTKVAEFTGATAGTAGVDGFVMGAAAGQQGALLMGDATWSDGLINIDRDTNAIRLLSNITSTGHLASFATNSPSMGTGNGRFDAGFVALNGYVYSLGGGNESAAFTSTVQFARLNADGSVGTGSGWTSTTGLPQVVNGTAATTYNGYIYVHGGAGVLADSQDIYYAKPNADGTITTWHTIDSPSGMVDHERAGMVAYNGFLYVVGGEASGGVNRDEIYYARIHTDGSVGAFTADTDWLPEGARVNPGVAVANGYLYIVGGSDGAAQNSVYYGKLAADGSPGAQASIGTDLPVNRTDARLAVANGYLYVIGGGTSTTGTDATNTVYYSALSSTGAVAGSWTQDTTTLPATRMGMGVVSANGYIYAIGGTNNASDNASNTVYYASTPRVQIGGSLDLVGFGGEYLPEGGSGGQLTAGNTTISGTLNVTGNAVFKDGLGVLNNVTVTATNNSTAAFAVLSVANVLQFSIDTSNSRTYIGNPTADTTGALLVLDTKSDAGDPTGVNGAMYYNSSMHVMRCFADSLWRNCNEPQSLSWGYTMEEDFFGSFYYNPDASIDINSLFGWTAAASGTAATLDNVAPGNSSDEVGRLGMIEMTTGTTTTGWTQLYYDPLNDQIGLDGGEIFEADIYLGTLANGTDDYEAFAGLCDSDVDCLSTNGIFFHYNRDTSTNWRYCAVLAGTPSCTTSSKAVVASTWMSLRIVVNSATSVNFYVKNWGDASWTSLGAAVTTNIPNDASELKTPFFEIIKEAGTADRDMYVDYAHLRDNRTLQR